MTFGALAWESLLAWSDTGLRKHLAALVVWVILGLLATTLAVTDLIAARERDRKPLGSSHRRFKRVP